MPIPAIENRVLMEQLFDEHYRRPPAWYEVVEQVRLEELAIMLSRRLRLSPESMKLSNVCDSAIDRIPRKPSDHGAYRGSTEPLSSASRRLHIPTDGMACLYRPSVDKAAWLRVKDAIAFEKVFWWDDSWLIDERGDWMLAGLHDWPAYLLQLPSAK